MLIKFKNLLKYFLLIILISSFSKSIAAEENFDKNYRKWQNLSIQEKKQLRKRYKTWKNMPQEKRNEIIKAYKNFDRFTPQQRRRLKDNTKTFKNLPEKQRKILTNKYKEFQSLPVEKKEEVISKRIERLQNLREKAIRSGNKNNAEKLNKRINVLKQMPNYRHTDAGVRKTAQDKKRKLKHDIKQQKLPEQIRKDRAKTGDRQIAPKGWQKGEKKDRKERTFNRADINKDGLVDSTERAIAILKFKKAIEKNRNRDEKISTELNKKNIEYLRSKAKARKNNKSRSHHGGSRRAVSHGGGGSVSSGGSGGR